MEDLTSHLRLLSLAVMCEAVLGVVSLPQVFRNSIKVFEPGDFKSSWAASKKPNLARCLFGAVSGPHWGVWNTLGIFENAVSYASVTFQLMPSMPSGF